MFRFLFGAKDNALKMKRETQRETVARAQKELNEILAGLSPKARITIYPEEGTFTVDLPEQMPDEAKALPAPEKTEARPAPAPEQKAPEAKTPETNATEAA